MVQAMIGAHPNAPVAPVSKDRPDPIGGQAIALGKRFHLPFRMTRAKGIMKCGRIQGCAGVCGQRPYGTKTLHIRKVAAHSEQRGSGPPFSHYRRRL